MFREHLWDSLVGSLMEVLFVCCLVWGRVGSPRNVGLGSTEGLSGAEEGRRQKTEMGRFSNVRGKVAGITGLAPPRRSLYFREPLAVVLRTTGSAPSSASEGLCDFSKFPNLSVPPFSGL